jgi:hypothetical protein
MNTNKFLIICNLLDNKICISKADGAEPKYLILKVAPEYKKALVINMLTPNQPGQFFYSVPVLLGRGIPLGLGR